MNRSLALLAATLVLSGPATLLAKKAPLPLGRIEFPVTAPATAREHFLRGMLAMHSFWYDEALDQFQAATKAAPAFAMGYWGAALTYYHPVWSQENLVASRAIMAKLPADAVLTDRERAFIDASRGLFGDGDREMRWQRYAAALGALHAQYPHDDEAATLYSAALLGAAKRGDGFRLFAEAAAASLEVLAHNPDHPGAAHYVIHAFDDPEHAILALPAARRYAQIAPEAFHALHMPSHIFVQLGMWPEAQASNEAAWAASVAAAMKKQLGNDYYDFHSLQWWMSISFERGQRKRAEAVLQLGRDALAHAHDADQMPLIVGQMAAEYLLTTGDLTRMDELLAPLATVKDSVLSSATQASTPGCVCHVAISAARAALKADALVAFMHGEAAAARKDAARLDASRQALATADAKMEKDGSEDWKALELVLDARAAELRGKPADAIALLRKAIALDERAPPSGPVGAVSPRERLGELLLRQGRGADALKEFRKSLDGHPARSRSLLGAARAAALIGDGSAHDYRAQLAANWSHADADTPGMEEARTPAAAR
jgi:tetratricopeptide (TPR) repeat protein